MRPRPGVVQATLESLHRRLTVAAGPVDRMIVGQLCAVHPEKLFQLMSAPIDGGPLLRCGRGRAADGRRRHIGRAHLHQLSALGRERRALGRRVERLPDGALHVACLPLQDMAQ